VCVNEGVSECADRGSVLCAALVLPPFQVASVPAMVQTLQDAAQPLAALFPDADSATAE
jgi:hypothetical protein